MQNLCLDIEECVDSNIALTGLVANQFCCSGWSTGVFDTQQLIPASSGFDHSSNQKDQKHFPAIQVSVQSLCTATPHIHPTAYGTRVYVQAIGSWDVVLQRSRS